jgi:hypothetical protein
MWRSSVRPGPDKALEGAMVVCVQRYDIGIENGAFCDFNVTMQGDAIILADSASSMRPENGTDDDLSPASFTFAR